MSKPAPSPWARLRATHREVSAFFGALDPSEALHRPAPGSWRPVDDLRHLTLATDALTRALCLAPAELEARFGRPTSPSRPCRDIASLGARALEEGATSPPAMVPEGAGAGPVETAHALDAWREAASALEAREAHWAGDELDGYRVPHPFLGPLTLREWLCFNHVHAHHHLRVARGRLGRA